MSVSACRWRITQQPGPMKRKRQLDSSEPRVKPWYRLVNSLVDVNKSWAASDSAGLGKLNSRIVSLTPLARSSALYRASMMRPRMFSSRMNTTRIARRTRRTLHVQRRTALSFFTTTSRVFRGFWRRETPARASHVLPDAVAATLIAHRSLKLLHSSVVKPAPEYQQFAALPSEETLRIAWPTPNHSLLDEPERFFARTRANADYGKPGWTRDCGKRFHRGCDIAPVNVSATGKSTRVAFTDCATSTEFESEEPTFVPLDEVFCVLDGFVQEIVTDESVSDFGKHIVVAHQWPRTGKTFFTLYAHLSEISVRGPIRKAQRIGTMGQSSRSADARNWMAIAPHLHFE